MLRVVLLICASLALAGAARADAGDDAATCSALLINGGDIDQAIILCTRALNARSLPNEQLALVFYNRGWAYNTKGDHAQAIADYDRALQIRPNYARAYLARGYSHVRRGSLLEAVADYSSALEITPEDFEARFNRGFVYEQLGDLERARADYRKAQAIRPDDPRIQSAVRRHQSFD